MEAVAVYRVSTQQQAGKKNDEGEYAGLDVQRDDMRAVAARIGATIVEEVQLVLSGTKVFDTDGFKTTLGLLASGKRALLVWDFDRLIRPDKFDQRSLMAVQATGCLVYTRNGKYDFDKPEDVFHAQVFAAVAGLERAKIRERTKSKKDSLRTAGDWVDGNPPTGLAWDRVTRKWTLTPDAPKVISAFQQYANGTGITEVARSTRLTTQGVRGLFTNRLYHTGRPGSGLAPLIDDATWTTVQQRLAGAVRRVRESRLDVAGHTPFSGIVAVSRSTPKGGFLLRDEINPHVMYGQHVTTCTKTYYYYGCRCVLDKTMADKCGTQGVSPPVLDAAVGEFLTRMTSDESQFGQVVKGAVTAPDSTEAQRAGLAATLADHHKKDERLARGWLDGRLTDELFHREQDLVRNNIKKAERRLAELDKGPRVTAADVDALVANWKFPANGEPVERRAWAQRHLQRIEVQV